MKSLLVTALAAMGVAHGGAFLDVWELPYVRNHFTLSDLGRKVNAVVKWDKTKDALRNARDEAREETLALYDESPGPRAKVVNLRRATPVKTRASKTR